MTEAHQRQAEILTRLLAGRISALQAAQLLGISARHLRRLRTQFELQGVAALVHGNTGKVPEHKTPGEVVEQITVLCGQGGPYHGLNVCHLSELLCERHGLCLGRSTLDRLLKEQGIRKSGRAKGQQKRQRRERAPAEGMLLQMDGSLHDWLEGRGARMCLIGAIDDATGRVLYLHFHTSETQEAYLRMLRAITLTYGLPMAAYHDKHTILRSPKKATIEEELAGTEPMSQVQRVLHELGIESIAAQSPQAKGRIERLWQTLQDRLVGEMRLADVADREAANAFLSDFVCRFNARFAKEAQEPEAAWVPVAEDFDSAFHFAIREQRTVKVDQTLSFLGRTLLLCAKENLSGRRVAVHVVPEGALFVYEGKRRVEYRLGQGVSGAAAVAKVAKLVPARSQSSREDEPTLAAQRQRRAWLFGYKG